MAQRRGSVTLTMAPLYAYVILAPDQEPDGGGGQLQLEYGLTEAVAFHLAGLWTGHDVAATKKSQGGLFQLASVAVGASYAMDALGVTPVIEASIGLLHRRLAGSTATDIGVSVGIKVHYWIRRWLGLGLTVHYRGFLSDLGNVPVYVDAGPQLAIRWAATPAPPPAAQRPLY